MRDSWPAFVAGLVLVAIAGGTAWHQWRYRQPSADDEEVLRQHAQRQLRRRLQVSALLGIIGVLIPLTDILVAARRSPLLLVVLVASILLLAFWIALLALLDLFSARVHHRVAVNRIQQQRRELERQLVEAQQNLSQPTFQPHELN